MVRRELSKQNLQKKVFYSLGESTIWEKVRKGEFPQPIRLSSRLTAWRIEEIEAWMNSKNEGGIK